MVSVLAASAALLLLVSGAIKVRTPEPAAVMISRVLGVPRRKTLARTAGVVEVAVAAAALAVGGPVALAAQSAVYAVLGAVVIRLMVMTKRSAQRVACGCFGSSSAAVGPVHFVVNATAALASVLAAAGGGPIPWRSAGTSTASIATCLQVVVLAGAAYLTLTALPTLNEARTRLSAGWARAR